MTTALQTLLTLVNGNVDTNNISPTAGITVAQHAAGVVRWNYATDALATHTLADGQLYSSTFNGAVTVTLPAATVGTLCAVQPSGFASGAQPVTVQRAGTDLIYGVGLNGVTSFALGTPSAPVVLFCPSAGSWLIVSGQQDTGWVALTLPANWAALSGAYVPAARKVGNMVQWCGGATNNTGGNAAFQITPPAGMAPASNVGFGTLINNLTGSMAYLNINSSGATTASTIANGSAIFLDQIAYRSS